jgi:hypothetical protein
MIEITTVMMIANTSTISIIRTTTILMSMKIVLTMLIGSSTTIHMSTGTAHLRSNVRIIGTGVTTILMLYFR